MIFLTMIHLQLLFLNILVPVLAYLQAYSILAKKAKCCI